MSQIIKTIPQQLYRPEQVSAHEAQAAKLAGVDLWTLMQRAGEALYNCFRTHYANAQQVAVLCGKGNNGGDGYVFAKLAIAQGYTVQVYAVGDPKTEDSQRAQREWERSGGEVRTIEDWLDSTADVVVDALLGTGLNTPLEGAIKELVDDLNSRDCAVIAADVPTGLHADTGMVLGAAVKAQQTVTMIALKRGLFTGEAAVYCGRIECADLGVAREFRTQTEASAWRLDSTQLNQWLPARMATAHKGASGHVLVIGGAPGMAGAAGMAGLSALRAGAGKVSVICADGQASLAAISPALMVRSGTVDDPELSLLVERADVIAIGPGLGQSDWGKRWWQRIVETEKPLIVDADALNLLALHPVERDNWILTPHPGEAARMLSCSTAQIQADRWAAAKNLQEEYGGVVILKGSGSIVASANNLYVCPYGSPAMATAGMGDVLTGILAGLSGQRRSLSLSIEETACAGVLCHAIAAEHAAAGKTRGIIATDILESLILAVNPTK